jgi:multidrug resistance efflux pump
MEPKKSKHRPPRTVRSRWSFRRIALGSLAAVGLFCLVAWLIPTTRWAAASGYISTDLEAELRPSVEGTIEAVLVRSADLVERSQVVIQLNAAVQQAALEEARGHISARRADLQRLLSAHNLDRSQRQQQITQANLTMRLAQTQLDRMTDNAGFSTKEVEDARLRMELAQSRLDELQLPREEMMQQQIHVAQEEILAAEKQLARLEAELELRKIRSPLAGTVQLHRFEIGEVVKPERVLGQVFDRQTWVVRLRLPERYIGEIVEGQRVKVGLAAYASLSQTPLEATVSRIERVVTPRPTGDGVFYVEATIPLHEGVELAPGMSAWAYVNTGKTNWLMRMLGV